MIRVMYVTDSNYAPVCAASMESLLENNKNIDTIEIYLCSDHLSDDEKKRFDDMCKRMNRQITFVDVDALVMHFQNSGLPLFHDSYGAYVRLAADNIIPSAEKVIYLDCDTLVLGNLQELYDVDIDKYAYGMACDWGASSANIPIGRKKSDIYFNSGVLLININFCRENHTFDKAIEDLNKYDLRKTATASDQDMINYSFGNLIQKLPMKYNVPVQARLFSAKCLRNMMEKNDKTYYSIREMEEAVRQPVILHFCLSQIIRPWYENCNDELVGVWDSYLNKSSWNGYTKSYFAVDLKRKLIMWAVKHLPGPFYSFLKRYKDNIQLTKTVRKEYSDEFSQFYSGF